MFYGFYCTGKLFGERSVSILRTRPVRLVFVSSISAFLVGIFLRQENHIQKQIIIPHHGHELVTLPELSLALHKQVKNYLHITEVNIIRLPSLHPIYLFFSPFLNFDVHLS